MIGKHFDFVDSKSPAPALLSEGKVHAHCNDIDIWQLSRFFVEPLGLCITHWRIERRHDAENSHVHARVVQCYWLQAVVYRAEIRRGIARFQFWSNERQGIALHSGCAWSFHDSS